MEAAAAFVFDKALDAVEQAALSAYLREKYLSKMQLLVISER